VNNKQGTLLLAFILGTPAFAFADTIPSHVMGDERPVTLVEGFTDHMDVQASLARPNTLLTSVEENRPRLFASSGASESGKAKDDKGVDLGKLLSVENGFENQSIKLVDFHVDQGAFFERDKGKIHGKHNGNTGDGDGDSNGNGASGSVVSVAEPGSQTLLLFGLAGLGMIFYRRNYLRNAI
jgi:hypothetical protein